jgi:hypothetical protein
METDGNEAMIPEDNNSDAYRYTDGAMFCHGSVTTPAPLVAQPDQFVVVNVEWNANSATLDVTRAPLVLDSGVGELFIDMEQKVVTSITTISHSSIPH